MGIQTFNNRAILSGFVFYKQFGWLFSILIFSKPHKLYKMTDTRNIVGAIWPNTICFWGILFFASLNLAVLSHGVETCVYKHWNQSAPYHNLDYLPYLAGCTRNAIHWHSTKLPLLQHVALCNSGQPLWQTFRVKKKITHLLICSGKGTTFFYV